MREIDERVVEMRFRNSNFEKNAKSTINVLDQLEQKLAFPKAKKNLEGLEKEFSKISFGALEKGIETVTLKFSALQVAGITAIQNITNKAINAGEALVKSLSIDQITSGFSKYEQKTTAVQTIVSATGKTVDEVNTSLQKLNWFTDETSYNFTDMVDNIGKFTSAGVELEDAMSAMIGIANEAAVSGQNAAAASRAMYNFAQAIGTGAVKLMDWKSIENANMATQEFKQTIIDTAVGLGTLEEVAEGTYKVVGTKDAIVSVANFNNELSKGWFTSDVLIKSLKQYSGYAEEIYELQQKMGLDTAAEAMAIYSGEVETLGEKAFKAGQVAKTLTDAIDATKDAVSSQWMNLFEMIVGNLDQAMETWTEFTEYLWDFFASDLVNMNDFLKPILTTDPYVDLIAELKELGIEEDQFGEIVKKNAKKHGAAIDDIIEREGSLANAIRKNGFGPIIRESIDELATGAEVTSVKVADLTDKFEEYQKVVNDVIKGNYKNGVEARTKALAEAGYEFSVIQPLVNKQLKNGVITVEDLKEVLGDLTEEELKSISITEEQANALKELGENLTKKSGRELIIDSFRNALKGLQKVISTVKEAWVEMFPPKTREEIYGVIEKFHDFSKNLILNEEGADKLKRSLKGVFAVLDIVKQVIGGAFKSGLTVLGKLFGKTGLDVTELSASLGDNLVALRDWLNEGNKIGVWFEALTYSILHAKEYIQGWFDSFMEAHPNFSTWFDGLTAAFDKFKVGTVNSWSNFVDAIKNGNIKEALNVVATYFLEFRDTVISYLTGIDFNAFLKKGENEFGFGGALNVLDSIKSGFWAVVNAIKNAAISVGGWVKEFVSNLNPLVLVPVMFAGALYSIYKIATALKVLYGVLKPLVGLKAALESAIEKVSKSISKYFDAAASAKKSASILNLAKALGILAASIWVLAQLNYGQVWNGVGAIAALTAVMVTANNIMAKWGKQGKGLARLTSAASALSGFALIMVAAIKILETVDPEKAGSVVDIVLAMFGGLAIAMVGISKLKGELPKINMTLITLAVTVGLISTSFLLLSLVPTDGMLSKVFAIGLVLAELLGVIAVMAIIQKKWKSASKRITRSLIGVVLALDLLVVSIKLIETVKVKEILKHLGSFIAVFGMLAILGKIAGTVGAGGGGAQILALAAGLLILVPAVNSFSKLELWGLIKAVGAVSLLLIMENMILKSSFASGQNSIKAGAMLLMASAAISAIALVVWGFSELPFKGLAQGTAAVGIIMWIITQMIYASEHAEGGFGKMVMLTAIVGIVSTCIIILSQMDADAALKTSAALSLVFLAIAGSMKLLEKSDGIEWKALGQMGILAFVGLPLIANLLEALNEIKTEGIIERATALSIVLLALSGASAILVKFGQVDDAENLKGAWITMGILAGLLVELAIIGGLLAHFEIDPDMMVKHLAALSAGILMLEVCTLGMIGLAWVVEKAGGATSILSSLSGVGEIIAIVGGIAFAVALIFGIIQEITEAAGGDMNAMLEKGVHTMTLIGDAIGSMVGGLIGGLVGGVGEGFMSHMEKMGEYLTAFGKAVTPFLDLMAKEEYAGVGGQISMLTDAILDLTAAEFISSLNEFGALITGGAAGLVSGVQNGPFDNLGRGLESFGASVEKIADKFADMAERGVIDDLNFAILVSSRMTDLLNKIPSQSIFEDFFKGKINWTNLTTGLVDYGKAVNLYALQAIALNTGTRIASIKASIPVAEDLNDLLDKIPKVGSWQTIFDGTSKWSTLSEGLEDFGDAMMKYGLKCYATRNNFGYIVDSKEAVIALGNMEDAVPKVKSVLGVFKTETSWSTLSTGLTDLGDGLVAFGLKAKKLKDDGVVSVMQMTVPLLDTFVDTVNEFTSIQNLGTIGDTIENAAVILGRAVGSFGDEIGGTDIVQKTQKGLSAANEMYEFAKTIKDSYLMGTELTNFGKDIGGYADQVYAAAKTLKNIENEDFAEIAINALKGFDLNFQNGIKGTTKVIDNWVIAGKKTVQDGYEINSPSKFFKWIAENCTSGFVHMFEKGFVTVKNASEEFTTVVKDTVQDGLGVHSDSTFTSWIAECFDGGFVHTLENGYNQVKTAVSGWVTNITDNLGLDQILDQFSDFGIDLKDVLPDLSSLGLGDGEDLTFNYEKQIADQQANIKELTKEWGANSEQVINAQLELDKLKDEYKDYTKSRTENQAYYEDKELTEAQKKFDKLIEDFKAGRKTQIEFDNEYTKLLQENTAKQAELFQYSAQKIQEYVTDSLDKVQEEFESKVSDIQSKMNSTVSGWNKSFDDEFKFTTRQDLFDEEISKYDKDLEQMNKRIEEQKKLRGENSLVVQHMQKDYDRLKKTRDEINEQWEEQDEDYKNEIVSVDPTGEWDKQAERAKKSLEAVDSLKGRLSQDMIDWLGTLDPDQLYAVATDWAKKSDSELEVITNKYLGMTEANKELAKTLYGPEIQEAEKKFIYDFNETLNKLPDTAKAIGSSVIKEMPNSFSEETNETLKTFKESGDVLIFAIKEGLGLTDSNSKPKNVGETVSNDIGTGFANNAPRLVEVFTGTLNDSLYEAVDNVDFDGLTKSLGRGLYEAVGNIDADSSVSISPVTSTATSNAVSNKRTLNSGRSMTMARETGTTFNQRYETESDNKPETTEMAHKAVSFVQNIYSPEPINRSEVRRDTKQLFQLANSKFK